MRQESLDKIEALRLPALQLVGTENQNSRSWLGGRPQIDLPFEWPSHSDEPMLFLAQIDLADLSEFDWVPLPKVGTLYFFYESAGRVWGSEPEDREGWKVIFHPETRDLKEFSMPDARSFERKFVTFKPINSYPPEDSEWVADADLEDEEVDELIDMGEDEFGEQPAHQLFGYVTTIQNSEMYLTAQILSQGLSIKTRFELGFDELAEGQDDWILLLQLDSDEDTGFMWGDRGMLYVMINKHDLAAQKFDNVWCEVQCY